MTDFSSLIFPAQDLDIPRLIDTLNDKGCVMIKGAFEQSIIDAIFQVSTSIFESLEQTVEKKPNHFYIQSLDEVTPGSFQMVNLLHQTVIPTLINQFFQQDSFFLDRIFSIVRRVSPQRSNSYVTYHQEGYPSNSTNPMINCWVPLVHCGEKYLVPTLELVTKGLDSMLPLSPLQEDVVLNYINIDSDLIKERFSHDLFWTPDALKGDIILFKHTTIHRSHLTPAMQQERFSMELRLYPQPNSFVGAKSSLGNCVVV